MGTELAGCRLYVPDKKITEALWDDFWLYQPTAKMTMVPYGGGEIPLTYESEECPEWIYTQWMPAPPPPERGTPQP